MNTKADLTGVSKLCLFDVFQWDYVAESRDGILRGIELEETFHELVGLDERWKVCDSEFLKKEDEVLHVGGGNALTLETRTMSRAGLSVLGERKCHGAAA